MMDYNQQQLQTFLIQAELINQKVKALAQNKISTQEIDKFAQQRTQDRKKRQQAKLRKEQQLLQKKRMGRDGKGIGKDFSHFCRFCHKQYELQTPTCLKCSRPTMTLNQRQAQLERMVEDYKFNKKSREQKRQKWEMFQKTQAALWKKSNINYNKKWEYFVQDSEQQPEKQPILPKHDPNFMALEADIQQRKKKRAKDTENAKRLKQKGNNAMKEGDYQKAMQFYTLALQHIKDIKSIYTNRALAFIKLKKYKKAIKDCTNVIEYMQIFQKVGQSKDLTFKAYSRRALAKKQIKEYKQALQDIKQALKLFPQDKNGLILKKQIESFIQHSEAVQKLIRENRQKQDQQTSQYKNKQQSDSQGQEQKSKRIQKQIIKQLAESQLKQDKAAEEQKVKKEKVQTVQKKNQKELNPLTAIPDKLKNLNEANVQYLLNLLINKKQYRSLFISSKGIQTVLDYLVNNQSPKNEALLINVCLDGDGVGQKRVWDWGVFKIFQLIKSKFQDETKLNQCLYGFVDNLITILVPITLSDIYRPLISSNAKTFQFIEFMFAKLITKHKKQPRLVDNFLTFFSNLCSGDSVLKTSFLKKDKVSAIVGSLFYMILDVKTKNRQILDLRQTVFSFIANLITYEQHRKFFVDYLNKNNKLVDFKQELQSYPRTAHNFQSYIENVLSVLANASIDGLIQSEELAETIFNRFIKNWQTFNSTIVFRALMIIGRLKYSSNKQLKQFMKVFDNMALKIDPLVKQEDKYIAQVVKILNILFMTKQTQNITEIPANLLSSLTKFIKQNSVSQQLFCNSCNLFGIILDHKNALTDKILVVLRPIIAKLVQIAKQKTGNWRKSAAILLGKSSFDPQCRQELNRNHGMQVLKSIAAFVTPNK